MTSYAEKNGSGTNKDCKPRDARLLAQVSHEIHHHRVTLCRYCAEIGPEQLRNGVYHDETASRPESRVNGMRRIRKRTPDSLESVSESRTLSTASMSKLGQT